MALPALLGGKYNEVHVIKERFRRGRFADRRGFERPGAKRERR